MRYLIAAALTLFAVPAVADDLSEATLQDRYCYGVKSYKKQLRKMDKLDADRRDTVGPVMQISFDFEPGEATPDSVQFRPDSDASPTSVFTIERTGDVGRTPNLADALRAASETDRLCVIDPSRKGRRWGALGYKVQTGVGVQFLATPGTHSMAELEDGTRDGRKHWKTMAGAMGFMVPTFDHVAVASDERDSPPVVTALKDGAAIGAVEGEIYDGARMVPLEALEEMGADAIRVEAEHYRLTPSPDAKTVARFAGGGDG